MKTVNTGPMFEDPGVSEETLAAIIQEARAFDMSDDEIELEEQFEENDEIEVSVLEDDDDDPAEQVLIEGISSLSAEEQHALVALAWIGRGDYEPEEFMDARQMAADRDNGDTAHYLSGMPMLGAYLEAGAAAIGISLEDTDAQTMSHSD